MTAARVVYAALVALHPAAFRMEFGAEMLAAFDEARGEFSARWLVWDALVSVLRQRAMREPEVRPVTAWGGGLRSGVYPFDGSASFTPGRVAVLLGLSVVPFLPMQPALNAAPVLQIQHSRNTILYYGPAAASAQECACSRSTTSVRATAASRPSAR